MATRKQRQQCASKKSLPARLVIMIAERSHLAARLHGDRPHLFGYIFNN